MKNVLCIDFGWSSIKSVMITDFEIIDSLMQKHNHDLSVDENFDLVLDEYEDFENIIVTGGRSHELKKVIHVDELESACLGALKLGNFSKGLVVNCGTGTSITHFDGESVQHLGGTGISGGTIEGLGKLLLDIDDFEQIEKMARSGNINKVNTTVNDIIGKDIGLLEKNMTASNFSKYQDLKDNDKAIGILSLVASSIASNSIQVANRLKEDQIIISGRLGNSKFLLEMINYIAEIFGKDIVAIDFPEFATACGAYLAYYK